MGIRTLLNKIRHIRDFEFQNVPASTAYTMLFFGLIHFVAITSAYIDLNHIQEYNWGIFKSLGLADSWQLPLITGVMIFDAFLMFYGWYLLRHIEPNHKKSKKKVDDDYTKDDYDDKSSLT